MPDNTLSIDVAVSYLISYARPSSEGRCARAVRFALRAGGFTPPNHPEYAKNYGPYLLNNGFHRVTTGCWMPRKGDIIVIQNYSGGHVAGHIAMYTGNQWISDFKQTDMWAGPGYRQHKPPYAIYRFGGPSCDTQ